jgi:hypothetical protein
LYVLHVMERPAQWVRAWKPEVPGIHEVFHARFVEHAYPSHTHDDWTVFTVDEGSIAYDLERRHRGVAGSKVTPCCLHTSCTTGARPSAPGTASGSST